MTRIYIQRAVSTQSSCRVFNTDGSLYYLVDCQNPCQFNISTDSSKPVGSVTKTRNFFKTAIQMKQHDEVIGQIFPSDSNRGKLSIFGIHFDYRTSENLYPVTVYDRSKPVCIMSCSDKKPDILIIDYEKHFDALTALLIALGITLSDKNA